MILIALRDEVEALVNLMKSLEHANMAQCKDETLDKLIEAIKQDSLAILDALETISDMKVLMPNPAKYFTAYVERIAQHVGNINKHGEIEYYTRETKEKVEDVVTCMQRIVQRFQAEKRTSQENTQQDDSKEDNDSSEAATIVATPSRLPPRKTTVAPVIPAKDQTKPPAPRLIPSQPAFNTAMLAVLRASPSGQNITTWSFKTDFTAPFLPTPHSLMARGLSPQNRNRMYVVAIQMDKIKAALGETRPPLTEQYYLLTYVRSWLYAYSKDQSNISPEYYNLKPSVITGDPRHDKKYRIMHCADDPSMRGLHMLCSCNYDDSIQALCFECIVPLPSQPYMRQGAPFTGSQCAVCNKPILV
jgi:hypothetical protein